MQSPKRVEKIKLWTNPVTSAVASETVRLWLGSPLDPIFGQRSVAVYPRQISAYPTICNLFGINAGSPWMRSSKTTQPVNGSLVYGPPSRRSCRRAQMSHGLTIWHSAPGISAVWCAAIERAIAIVNDSGNMRCYPYPLQLVMVRQGPVWGQSLVSIRTFDEKNGDDAQAKESPKRGRWSPAYC